MRKPLLFLIVFFILLVIAGFYFYRRNIYSKEILKLEILGEVETQAFEEVEYLVKYKNNGNATLEEPELIFQYPENSLVISENTERVVKKLDDIYPGQETVISFKARLAGKENEAKTAQAFLKYRPKNLKAFYES